MPLMTCFSRPKIGNEYTREMPLGSPVVNDSVTDVPPSASVNV